MRPNKGTGVPRPVQIPAPQPVPAPMQGAVGGAPRRGDHPFDRWGCLRKTTLALRVFRVHHTELNSMLWAFVPAIANAERTAKNVSSEEPTGSAFNLTGVQVTRIPTPIRKWAATFRLSQTWMRLSALMALASYFEVYLTSAIRLAIESDPGVLIGASRSCDGVALLKSRDAAYSYLLEAENVVNGEWSGRLARFEKLLGSAPARLKDAVPELDWIRRVRNGVGHTFGRPVDAYKARVVRGAVPLQALGTARLQRLLGLVDEVAGAVDAFLLERHIGEYEALVLWHEGQAAWRARHDRLELLGRGLRDHTGVAYGREYCRAIVRHYEAL
jgi:hypothetical protein